LTIISLIQEAKLNKNATFHIEKQSIIVANVYIAPNANIEDIINFIKFILEQTCNNYPIVHLVISIWTCWKIAINKENHFHLCKEMTSFFIQKKQLTIAQC